MTQRTKLELPINRPVEIELLYDEPVTGKSQYGQYYMYAVNSQGTEYTYFAPEEVHAELKQLRKGNRATITKLATQRGNKLISTYDVHLQPITTVSASSAQEHDDLSDTNNDDDGLYAIMLKSYRDAINITGELGGLADPSRIAITLFIARSRSQ